MLGKKSVSGIWRRASDMADKTDYESVLSARASAFLIAQPKRRQRQIIDLASRLAAKPFQLGDYATTNEDGRELQHLDLGVWVFSYWVDHAVRELRITEIDEL